MTHYPTESDKTPTTFVRYGVRASHCESCHAEYAVLYTHTNGPAEYLCPKCAQKAALWEEARRQMRLLLSDTVQAWHDTWGDVEGVGTVAELLSALGAELDPLYPVAREGVQPAQPEHLNAAD